MDSGLLELFVCRCLRLYSLSKALCQDLPVSERRPGDDAAVLAALALLHIADAGDSVALLRSMLVLECLLNDSRHHYDALLIQICLCLKLGVSSLAIERYLRLSVKNMQQVTVSWVLYTQISTIHPYPYLSNGKTSTGMDLLESITSALKWFTSAAQNNEDSLSAMLRDGQFNMVIDTIELDELIQNSFTKVLLFAERLRIQRLTGLSGHKLHSSLYSKISSCSVLDANKLISDDNGARMFECRDITVFPNYEGESNSTYKSCTRHGMQQDVSQHIEMRLPWHLLNMQSRNHGYLEKCI